MLANCDKPDADKAVLLAEKAFTSLSEVLGTDNPVCAKYLAGFGFALNAAGEIRRSVDKFSKARVILETAGEIHGEPYAWILFGLGSAARQQGDYADAESFLLRAMNTIETNEIGNLKLLSYCGYETALMLEAKGDLIRAERWMGLASEWCDQAFQPYDPNLAKFFEDYARILVRAGKTSDAAPVRLRAEEIHSFLAQRKLKAGGMKKGISPISRPGE